MAAVSLAPMSTAMPAPQSAPAQSGADGAFEDGLDAIEIRGIRCYGYTGYFPEEQVLGQWFEVDLTIWMDLSITGGDDELANTLNYAEVVGRVTDLLENSRFKTIERLNAVITESVLAFPPVRRVHSRLVKVSPPIPRFEGRIAIAMTRSKHTPL